MCRIPMSRVATTEARPREWSVQQEQRLSRWLREHRELIASSLNLDDPTEVEELLEDTKIALQRAFALAVTEDFAPSSYRERLLLEELGTRRLSFRQIDALPFAVQSRIARHYPGGWLAMKERCQPDLLRAAIRKAIDELPRTRRGRSAGSTAVAPRQLGLELADIYRSFTGRRSARRHDHKTGGDYGPFVGFVALACTILNSELRLPGPKRTAAFSVASVVRHGIGLSAASQGVEDPAAHFIYSSRSVR